MKFKTIHSLGSRCQNSEILKFYGFREFAGFFDFMNTHKVSTIKHILSDDFNEILKDENNVSLDCFQTTIEPETGELLPHSVRTSNKFYNENYNNPDESIFPHHDLNSIKDKEHFLKCKNRFKKLINYNTLFNYTYNIWENDITTEDMGELVNIIKNVHNFKNFKFCFIGVKNSNESKFEKLLSTEFYDSWLLTINDSFSGGLFNKTIDNENYISIIKTYDIDENRINKEEIEL